MASTITHQDVPVPAAPVASVSIAIPTGANLIGVLVLNDAGATESLGLNGTLISSGVASTDVRGMDSSDGQHFLRYVFYTDDGSGGGNTAGLEVRIANIENSIQALCDRLSQ